MSTPSSSEERAKRNLVSMQHIYKTFNPDTVSEVTVFRDFNLDIPRGQFGIVGENGPEIVNGPANVTSRRNTAALAAVVAGMMGVAAAPAELPPLHPLALPAKGGEAIVSRAATVPLVQRIEAPTQIIIQTQPGQSAQDIAREVARQLDERERRLKAKAKSNYSDQGGYDA